MSTCTRKVLTVLAEHNTPFEMVVIDLGKAEHKGAEHLARQPFGQIPAIDDDGFHLYESRAIARYLDAKHGGSLTPKDQHARALMEQWISIEQSNFSPNAMKLIYQYMFYPARGLPIDQAKIDEGTAGVEKSFAVMETQLASHPYIAGAAFTVADICYMPYMEYLMATQAKELVGKYPHVSAWWTKISERPSWRRALGKA
jgi:glutathione S-transferase